MRRRATRLRVATFRVLVVAMLGAGFGLSARAGSTAADDRPQTRAFTVTDLKVSLAMMGRSSTTATFPATKEDVFSYRCAEREHVPCLYGQVTVLPDSAAQSRPLVGPFQPGGRRPVPPPDGCPTVISAGNEARIDVRIRGNTDAADAQTAYDGAMSYPSRRGPGIAGGRRHRSG